MAVANAGGVAAPVKRQMVPQVTPGTVERERAEIVGGAPEVVRRGRHGIVHRGGQIAGWWLRYWLRYAEAVGQQWR
jgi:hypothetical protein